jgi:L-iditol 2-dehydrogenase
MKAAIYFAPNDIHVQDIPAPRLAKQSGLLLKVLACGLCGSDLRTLQTGHPKVTPPFILGHEICGEVVDIEPGVATPIKPGSRLAVAPLVFCGQCRYCQAGHFQFCEHYREIGQSWPGGFEEYMLIPPEALERGVIHAIPESLDPAHAAVSEPLAACLHSLDSLNFELTRTVVIFGAGTIGCLLLQLLRLKGVQYITLIDPNESRLRIADRFHPDKTINISQLDTSIEETVSNQRFDLVFTATASPIVQSQALNIVEKGGQIVVFSGLPREQSEIKIDYNQIHYRNLRIVGSSIYAPTHHEKALGLIAEGKIKVEELITRYSLINFQQGVRDAMSGKIIKAVFLP